MKLLLTLSFPNDILQLYIVTSSGEDLFGEIAFSKTRIAPPLLTAANTCKSKHNI